MKKKSKFPVSGRSSMAGTSPITGQLSMRPQPHGEPSIPRRSRRKKRVKFLGRFKVPQKHQAIFLDLPVVRLQLCWQRRVMLMQAATAMLQTGYFSLNATARVLDVSSSQLSVLLRAFETGGAAAIMPKARHRTAVVEACRLGIYLCP
jgi:hypothetical protein